MNHSLKHPSRRITASLILLALCFCSAGVRHARANHSDEIVLAQGTAINVVTAQEITSKDAKPNDPVHMTDDKKGYAIDMGPGPNLLLPHRH